MNKKRISTKDIAIAALLTALAIAIPLFMPLKLVLEPIFSATFASHVPGILSMFVGPFAVVGTAVGSALGFTSLGPWVMLRALSHMIFGLVGCKMLQKRWNIFLVLLITALIHAGSEMIVGLISIPFIATPDGGILKYIIVTIGCGTFIHHCIDFAISVVIFYALKSARLLQTDINFKHLKSRNKI